MSEWRICREYGKMRGVKKKKGVSVTEGKNPTET